ncbi:ensconsin isoform X2 [Falco cherrug]|uniref:ensconsin isoform X2 n=1 Tax=Falco cherrug TaxID=345164 RepID=UPI00247AFBE9|nr:ensconsin isoform X2 [Falco cherrug]
MRLQQYSSFPKAAVHRSSHRPSRHRRESGTVPEPVACLGAGSSAEKAPHLCEAGRPPPPSRRGQVPVRGRYRPRAPGPPSPAPGTSRRRGGGRGALTCPRPRIRGAEQPRSARRHGGGRGPERRVPVPRRSNSNMPGSTTALRQERLRKSARPNPLGLFTINEEDEQQKNGNSKRLKAAEGSKIQDKKATSGQSSTGTKPDHPTILKVDDRQRLARERREEREKQLAARESVWLEREERARQHYEKHLEERRKKLEEQRLKEERRRAAVEEKRRQRIEEDKERHEAVVRRTIERSQKPKQKQNRWSWGGALHNRINNTGYFFESSFTFLDLAGLEHHFRSLGGARKPDPDRRSVSTMNLSKHVDPVINKRLSSSSATLLNSPDRARRLQLSPWESSIVSRLLTPTHSFLARSKSTAALSGDAVIPICPRSASCSPISPLSYKTMNCRNPGDRAKLYASTDAVGRRKTTHLAGTDKKEKERDHLSSSFSASFKGGHFSSNPKARSPAPSPVWHASKSLPFLPGTPKQITSPPGSSKVSSAQARPPSPGNIRPVKKEIKPETEKKRPEKEPEKASEEGAEESKGTSAGAGESATREELTVQAELAQASLSLPPALPVLSPPPAPTKTSAGTTDAEEATRLLTEKRRLAREQREREEQERREREEFERQKKEELSQRIAEERARREEEEARRQEAEKTRKDAEEREKEERLRRQAEEREQKEKEEMERIQKQKEEEVRLREEAERIRLEREKHFQREEQERLERKKRLEEIMKRTRRVEAVDKKPNDQQNGHISKANITGEAAINSPASPLEPAGGPQLQHATQSPHNSKSVTCTPVIVSHQPPVNMDSNLNPEKNANGNGMSMQNDNFEEIINLPIGSKPSRLDAVSNDGSNSPEIPLNPMLAFEDKGTLLPQVDSVQTHQTAEVI